MAARAQSKRITARRRPAARPARPTLARRASDFLRIHFWAILGLSMMAVLVHDLFGEHGFLAMRRQLQEKRQLEQEVQQIQEQNRALSDSIRRLKTDPAYIERLAREQHGLARPGEHVFKLPPKEKPDPRTESARQ